MKPDWSWRRSRPVIGAYVAVVLLVAAASIITVLLRREFPSTPNALFFCAVILSAWLGGRGPGLFASFFAAAACVYCLPPPSFTGLDAVGMISRFIVFFFASLFICWICSQQRQAQAGLRQARDELEQRVDERTKELTAANEALRIEIGERKQTETLLDGQKRVLEMIAADALLPESLAALIQLMEAHAPGMLGSILLIDEQGVHLRHGAAPSLPPEYTAAIDGGAVGPNCGSCGTAAYRKESVIVGDIATDELWKDYRAVALQHGLRACWSTPIFDAKHRLLGTFAMYYRQPALPQPEHQRLIEMATHVAAIAICRDHSQAALRESEAKLKEAQRLANIGYWERDLIADRITWSEDTYRIWGQPQRPDGFNQAELQKMIYLEDRELQSRALAEAVAGVRRYDVELRIVRPDGEVRFVHVTDAIVCDGSGRPIRMFGTVQDITERKRTEIALRRSEQRLHSLVETAPIAIVYCDSEGFLESYNPKAVELWGRAPSIPDPKERYCGSYRIYREDGTPIPLSENAVARVLQSGKAELGWEVIIERPDGTKVFAISNVAPLKNAQGKAIGVVACIVDITERKRAEELLRAQEQEIKAIVENSPDPIVRFDPELRRTYVNPAFVKINQVPKESLLGRKVGSAVEDGAVNATGEEVEILHRSLKRAFDTGRPLDFETTWPWPTGRRCFAVHLEPEFDARGVLTSVLSIARDITEHKQAEEAVRESQQLLRLVLATLPVGVAVTDQAGNIVLDNEATKRIWGKSVVSGSERWAHSKGFWHGSGERIAPENWASVRALSEGQTSVNELIDIETFEGQKKIIQNSSAPIRNTEGSIVGALIVNEDVTEQVRAEEALQKSEQRFRQLFASAPISIWEEDFSAVGDWLAALRERGVHDLDAFLQAEPQALKDALALVRLVDVNETTLRLFEAGSKEELLGLWPRLFTEEIFYVFAGELRAVWEDRNQVEFECSAQTVRGRRIHYLLHWVAPLEDGRMNLRHVIVVIADITERKKNEEALRQTQGELARVSRLTMLGELTASIAHEVNQPLAAVVTNAYAASRWLASEPPNLNEARRAVQRIARDGNRASEVIKRIRALIKKSEPVRDPLNLNELVQETIALMQPELTRKKVSLQTDLAPELPRVPADRVQLQQVLLNLVVNAVDSLSAVADRPRSLRIRTNCSGPDVVHIAIQDTGVGIKPHEAERLFEPFYTTKPNGLGMGLAISRSIVEAHGGRLWATPDDGRGATFEFTLPIQDGGGS